MRFRLIAAVFVVVSGAVTISAPAAAQAAPSAAPCALRDPFVGMADELARRFPRQRFTATAFDQGCEYHLNPQLRITTASVVKVQLMAGALLRAQRAGRALTAGERALIWPMITSSANPPASTLFRSLGGANGMQALDNEFGLADTVHPISVWGLTSTSAADQVRLVRSVIPGHFGPLGPSSRAAAREFMTNVVPSQRWGASAGVPAGWTVSQKNGFASSRCCRWRINTVGWIERPDGTGWAVALLSDGWPTQAAGIAVSNAVSARINRAVLAAPFGHLDDVGTTVRGWAADASDTRPIAVHIYVDDALAAVTTANLPRPDMAATHPDFGETHGFEVEVPNAAGRRVCAYGINAGPAAPNTLLGCS